jgi:hypothetical protein
MLLPHTAFVGGAQIEYPRLMSPHQQQQGYFPNPQPLMPYHSCSAPTATANPLDMPETRYTVSLCRSGPLPIHRIVLSQHTTPTYGRPGLSGLSEPTPTASAVRAVLRTSICTTATANNNNSSSSSSNNSSSNSSTLPRRVTLPAPPAATTATQAQVAARPASPTHDTNGLAADRRTRGGAEPVPGRRAE